MAVSRSAVYGTRMDLIPCRETPPCGSPVIDNARERKAHHRWHQRVYISEPEIGDRDHPGVRRPRYVGEPDESRSDLSEDPSDDPAPV